MISLDAYIFKDWSRVGCQKNASSSQLHLERWISTLLAPKWFDWIIQAKMVAASKEKSVLLLLVAR
jgi:hypothetical protein